MKKTKFAMLLVMVLVFVLQSVGMMHAEAEDATPAISVENLSVDYIFGGLGEALTYGVVADEFYQMTHAETSVCVETLYKYADQPFMNTDKTYTVSQMRPIKASVSVRPTEGQTLNGTKYALFTVNGDKLEMCEGTVVEVNEDVDVTVLTWELEKDSPYRWENLCVRQVRGAANEIVEEGAVVMPGGLTVTYGPDISSAAPSSSYVGNIVSDQERGTIKFHNTIDSDQPVELGSTRLVVKTVLSTWNIEKWAYDKKDQWRDVTDGSLKLAYDWPAGWPAVREYEELVTPLEVYVEYTVLNDVDSEGNPVIHRAKYSSFVEDGGAFELKYERDDATGKVSFYFEQDGKKYYHTFTSTTGKATKLLQQATEFSKELAQLQGGQSLTNDINADPSLFGNSTVASGLDANNRVVSVYSATITNGLIDFDASSEVLDKQIHIAPNEYVIVNVICDPDAESVTVGGPGVAPPYIYAAGKQEQATWPGEPGSDTGSPDRVLYNFVTLGDDGKYKPYTGKIQTETQYYGGTFLAPEADIVTGNAVINGALIAKSVKNPQNELHQRTMLQAAQTTWVKMAGRRANGNGAIYLKKFDATTEQLLNDAVFGLFTDEAAAKAATMESIDDQTKIGTTVDGEFTFNNLTPGTYYVKELKAPAGYVLNNAVFTVEVQANGIAVVGLEFGGVPNNSENGVGWLSIDKVDATNNNKKIANAVFEVYACEGDTFDADKAVLADTITTDANGNAQSKLLNAGTYWVKETNAAFGYLPQEAPVKVIITKEKVTYVGNSAGSEDKVSFTNEEAPTGTLSFVKQDADYPDTKLSGAKFAIYAESDVDLAKPLKTFETQWGTGKVEEKLPVGTYRIAETQAPQNYTITFEPQLITITEGETTQIGTDGVVTNEYVTASVKFGKVEVKREYHSYPWGGGGEYRNVPYALAGAWFGVYSDVECKDLVALEETGEDGFAYFTLRADKTYYVKELAAPKGYELSDALLMSFQVNKGDDSKFISYNTPYGYFDSSYAYQQWHGALINAKAEETGTLKLYKNTWDLDPDGLPDDGTDNRENVVAVKGAVFGFYFDEACKMPIEGSPFTTGEDGGIVVSGLTPGKYWVKELEAAPGYLLNDDLLWVEVKAGDTDARVHWQDANGNDYRWIYNAVAAKPAEVQVEIEKTVDTEYLLPEDAEYTFEMEYVSGPTTGYQFVGGENTTTVDFRGKDGDTQKTHGPGASFSPIKIKFTEAGTYVFTVSEASNVVAGELTSMKYDPEVYTITYQVNTDTDGNLKLEPKAGTVKKSDGTTNHGPLAFENAYKTVDITCSKVWQDGDDDRLRIDAGTFKSDYLELYVLKQDKDGQIVKDEKNKEVLIPVTNADLTAWKASFTIEPETGKAKRFRWYYHGLPGFDEYGNDALYVIKELTVTGYQTFYYNAGENNSYRPEATDALYPKTGPNATRNTIYNTLAKSSLEITKKVTGENAPKVEEFQFTITPDANTLAADGYTILDKDGNDDGLYTLTMDADGINGELEVEFLFDSFRYDADVPTTGTGKDADGGKYEYKTFTFEIVENTANIKDGWTYDPKVVDVVFTVKRYQDSRKVVVEQEILNKEDLTFTNIYESFSAASEFVVDKGVVLTGSLTKDEIAELSFDFVITPDQDNTAACTMSVKSEADNWTTETPLTPAADGTYALKMGKETKFVKVTFPEPGEYTFTVEEVFDKHPDGWVYDDHTYTVTFSVDADGIVTKEESDANDHLFSNDYQGTKLLTVFKEWVLDTADEIPVMPEEFLTLLTLRYAFDADDALTEADWKVYDGEYGVGLTEEADDLWRIDYTGLPKTIDGERVVWSVVETAIDGFITEYDNDEGNSWASDWEGITNTYNLTSVTVYKEWDGGNLKDSDITQNLTLYADDVKVDTKPERTGNAYTWMDLPKFNADGTEIKYTVKETTVPAGYQVEYEPLYSYDPETDEECEEEKDYALNGEIIFNRYYAAMVEVNAKKTLDGVPAKVAFDFILYQIAPDGTETVLQIVSNAVAANGSTGMDSGDIRFNIRYDGSDMGKTYEYVARERAKSGYSHDTTEYRFTVTIDEAGVIKTTAASGADVPVFKNQTLTNVAVTKEWVGGKYDGSTEPVSLTLYANGEKVDAEYNRIGNEYSWRNIPKYDEDGELIVYSVKEIDVAEGYKVTYLNKDGEDAGEYVPGDFAQDGGKIVNTYAAKGSIKLEGTKVLKGRELKAGEFSFELKDAAGNVLQSKSNAADGSIVFDQIEYSLADVANSPIKYTISEVAGSEENMTYATNVEEVSVTLTDNGDGTITAQADKSNEEIKFVNTYEEEEYTASGFIVLKGTKVLEGRELEDDEFSFEVKDASGEVVATGTNKADGKVTFSEIEYTEADAGNTYTYEVYEVKGDLAGVTYVEEPVTVKVTVTDDGDGTLTAVLTKDSPAINFTNTYEREDKTSASINKVWLHESFESADKVPNIADKLTLCKLVDGVPAPVENAPTPVYIPDDEDSGMYTWDDLPMFENGKEIEYVVVEQKMDGYEQTYFDRYGCTIENGTYAPHGGGINNVKVEEEIEITNVSITKVWVGGPLADSDISDNLVLFADGVAQTDKPAKTDNVYSWYDLPKYDGNDELISYSVKEDDVADGYTVTYQDENGEDAGDAAFDGGMITNTYEEKTYESKGEIAFDGIKIFDGHTMEGGEFTFILTDKSGKELQRVTNAEDGSFAFDPIKYTEKDVPYGTDAEFTYYITELEGNLPGVTYDDAKYEITVGLWDDTDGTIHVGDVSDSADGIIFTNTYKAEGSVTFQGAKFLLGREFKAGDEFTFELLNEKGDVIDTVTINPTSGTKADFAFKTIKYDLDDAGKNYTYTYRVKEKAGTEDGMTYDDTVHTVTVTVSDAGDGTLKVVASDAAKHLNFTNTYLAEGAVIFSGTKTMEGKELAGNDFTFVLTDADGKVIETVTNDEDGKIVFSTIEYELEDAGKTFTYKVSEKNDGKKAVTYDDTVYTVTVKVEDAGSGHLKVTASDNATKLNFKNSYEAKAVLTMNAYKTVNGYKPSVDQVYDFVLQGNDGTEMKAQNKAETITFGTIAFDEEDIGKTFIYTVKETTEANELLDVDAAIYQVKVTVADNGDGNLKLETEILKDGKRANGVVFANTATATLAISKNVKGPGPDKAFDLKVTFIGVDGKELEGVYDYDGDVKGTITSGGVIALKDGQSVTIVGLPEGATYTVEENAGPAYTVTVNGKPIAKAEGTLVGHGKLEFINTVEVTTFSVTKVWEGTDLGEITLTLYADGKQITPQPEVTREGNKYTYYNLPKYNEEGEEIVYSAKERGIDGYIRIYNNVEPYQDVTSVVHDGGTIVNRETHEEVHELSFKIHKVWTGVEATEEIPAITLTLYCNGEKLDVPTPKPDSEGWYRYYDLPKSVNGKIAVYTVIEEPIAGYTVTYKTAGGEIVEEGVNGGEIVNAKIPQTGDHATLGLWLALMGASAVLLTMLQRRRKA